MGETPAMFGCDIMSNEMCLKSVRRCLYLSEHVECKLSIRSHDKVSYGTTIFSQSKVKINFSRLISQRCVYIRCSEAPWADFLKNDKIQKYFLGSVTWNMYRKVRSEVTECQTHAHSAFLRPRRRINRTYSEFWESLSSWQNARRGVVIATTRVTRVETFWNQNFFSQNLSYTGLVALKLSVLMSLSTFTFDYHFYFWVYTDSSFLFSAPDPRC